MSDAPATGTDRQRLDKWLFFARLAKSRTLAAQLVTDGCVRINGQKIDTPAKPLRSGDVLTLSLPTVVRVIKVLAPGDRRGPASEAALLLEDVVPPVVIGKSSPLDKLASRAGGTGRPTKRERRATDRLLGRN